MKKTKSKFIVGNTPTLADFVLCSEMYDFWYMKKGAEVAAKYPAVRHWMERCEQSPGMVDVFGAGSALKKEAIPLLQSMADADRLAV